MPSPAEALRALRHGTRALEQAAELGDLDAMERALTLRERCVEELGGASAPAELVRELLASDARARAALEARMRNLREEISRVRNARSIADGLSSSTPARFFNERI